VAPGLKPSKQMTQVRFPHSAPILFLADSPTGCGNRTINPDALRSSRRSAANLRPLMRQVSQQGCLPGESGSLPLVVANPCPVSSDVKSVGPTNRRSQALNLHWAPIAALDGDGPWRDCNPRVQRTCLVRLQDAAPAPTVVTQRARVPPLERREGGSSPPDSTNREVAGKRGQRM
jgi:hypothetical protein